MEIFLKDLLCSIDSKTEKMWRELADSVTKDKVLIIEKAERELSHLDYEILSNIYDDERYAVILDCMDELELSIEEIVGVVSPEIIRAIGHEYISYLGESNETIIRVSLSHSIWNFYITQECACDFIKGPEFLSELEGDLC